MSLNSINFNQIKESPHYDLSSIYNESSVSDVGEESVLLGKCEYYDPCNMPIERGSNPLYSCFHLNCRGLSNNWDKFTLLLNDLHSETFKFDFIGISEAFNCEGDNRLKLPGYHKPKLKGRTSGIKGGIGLFISEDKNVIPRDDLSVFIPNVFESIFVEINNGKSKNLIVGIIYRPNTFPLADMDIFSNTLFDIMDMINKENKTSVIMGDMNIDLLKYKIHNGTSEYLDTLFSNGFLPLITKPTRITDHSATLIDHIYTNDLSSPYKSGIIITDLADHFGIFTMPTKVCKKTRHTTNDIRVISDINVAAFNSYLQNTNFTDVIQSDCANSAYNIFLDKYKLAFNQAFPMKTIRGKKHEVQHEPWITEAFLTSQRQKNKLFKKKLSNPSEQNITNYKTYNTVYNKLKRKLKSDYYINLIEKHKYDMKKTWSILNSVVGKDSSKQSFPNTFIVNGKSITDKRLIANEFNNFFSEIGYQTGLNVPKTSINFDKYLINQNYPTMFLRPVSSDTVINTTLSLKSKLSTGHDHISTKLLKQSIVSISEPMTHVINLSISEGRVPDQLKVAKVIPIFKSGDQSLLNNYRPISLLPAFSKLFERIIYNKIMDFLNDHDILYSHQYGFRPKHSTIHPILHFLNHCAEASNKTTPDFTLAVFCDLSKAFDVINHDILLCKLNNLGLRGKINDWLRDYLTDRKQFVQFENDLSTPLAIKCGVPQGSILGPLLYLLYVNDIKNACTANILSFADDTTLYLSDPDLSSLYHKANKEINQLYNWFCANRLSLNAKKTKYIVIKSKYKNCDFEKYSVSIGNTVLTRIGNTCKEESIKFLGIHIDENLTWKYHLKSVNSKISRSIFSLKQVKKTLPLSALKTLYNSLIQPHLNYGIIAWGCASLSMLRQTVVLQKRAMRLINNASYNSHTEHLFKKNSILKINDLYELNVVLFMHDYGHNRLPASFTSIFKYNHEVQTLHVTRQSSLFYVPKCHTKFCKQLPFYTFPNIWNNRIKVCDPSLTKFTIKKRLKHDILSGYSNSRFCSDTRCKICIRNTKGIFSGTPSN